MHADTQTLDAPPRHWRRRLRDLAHVAERAAEQVRCSVQSGEPVCELAREAAGRLTFVAAEMLRLTRESGD